MYKALGNFNNKIDEIGGRSTDHHMNMHWPCGENTCVFGTQGCSLLLTDRFKGNLNGDVPHILCDPVFGDLPANQYLRQDFLIDRN